MNIKSILALLLVLSFSGVASADSKCDGQIARVINALALADSSIKLGNGPTFLTEQKNIPGDEGSVERAEVFEKHIGGLLNLRVTLLRDSNCRLHSAEVFYGTDEG